MTMKNLSLIIFLMISSMFGSVGVVFASNYPGCPEGVYNYCYTTYSYPNGDRYIGDFVNDRKTGDGIYINANGGEYVGEWRNNIRHGEGIYYSPDGKRLEGIFKNGVFHYEQNTRFSNNGFVLEMMFLKLSTEKREQLQSNLKDKGFYTSSIDSLYGKGTAGALTAYNKQNLNDADLNKPENVENLINAVLGLKPSPKAVPEIKTPTQANEIISASSGSGFPVSSDGYIITNHHVIDGCEKVVVHTNGDEMPVKVIAYDPQNDLALLKGDFRPRAVFALSDSRPQLLQDIYVAGFPFGDKLSTAVKVTKGIVSSLTGLGNNFSNIQIDAALQSGNSGGPILDDFGNVVGVAVSKLDAKYMFDRFGIIPENTNFGIKSSVVGSILDSNGVDYPVANKSSISKSQLGKMISDGTYYISCWMTMAQIEKMKTKKVMFEAFD